MNAATAFTVVVLPPGVAIVVALVSSRARAAEWSNLLAAVVCAIAAVGLVVVTGRGGAEVTLGGYLLLDALAGWAILCVALVYLLASIYSIGYIRHEIEPRRLGRFYALFAGFALTMFLAPAMNHPGLYWIAIELTTLVSTFLVGFHRTREGTEAAWKYIIIVSAGISLALLGTMLMYWAGTFELGPRYDMTWAVLHQAAGHGNPLIMSLAFLLILVGYGTKVGLAPMHTWLPDAHSQGPTPVSAMLSGALLNTAMVGIVRSLSILDATGRGTLGHGGLVLLGIVSLLAAAFLIVRQTDVKRLMAYSSVEHMGVIALGFGFGGPLGIAAALYHMVGHSLNKSLMFFGAGNAARACGGNDMTRMGNLLHRLPTSGGVWLAGAVAITGAPPFALFLSEFNTLRAGLRAGYAGVVAAVLVLLVVIFVGFLNHFRGMALEQGESEGEAEPVSRWCLVPMWLALIPLVVLGLWWPTSLTRVFHVVAQGLGTMTGGGS